MKVEDYFLYDPTFLIEGIFKRELKNRFRCIVEINGTETLCYVPASCKLSNYVDLTGKTVILKRITSSKAGIEYAICAVRYGNGLTLLDLSYANRLVEDRLGSKRFDFLGARKKVLREVYIAGYKCDLYIEDSKTIVEIKSIVSFNKQVVFPSTNSLRAIKQLERLSVLLESGYNVVFIRCCGRGVLR